MSSYEELFSDIAGDSGPDMKQLGSRERRLVKKGQRAYAARLASPRAVGDYEARGGELAASVHPLALSDAAKRHAASDDAPVVGYERDFNAYVFPLRATFRSMGRLADLSRAGTPLDPAQAKADPSFRKMSEKLRPDTRAEHAAFDQWSEQQSELRVATFGYEAAQAQLQSALTGFQAAQYKLTRMRKAAEKKNAEARQHEIDEMIDTLVEIVDKAKLGLSVLAKIDNMVSSTWTPELDTENLGSTAAEQKAIDEALAAGASTRSRQQKGIDGAMRLAKALKVSTEKAKGWLEGAGFGVRDLFMVASGNASEYDHLTKKIHRLDAQIQNLGIDIEMTEIKQAEQALDAFSMQLNVSTMAISSERKQARDAAATFGSAAGNSGRMAMYAVNAYEELALVGGHAHQLRHSKLDGKAARIGAYLLDPSVKSYYRAHNLLADHRALYENVAMVQQQRDYFHEKVPEWQARKSAWESYLEELTDRELVK